MANKTKYKKEFCGQLVEHMSEGFSFASFAGKIGVARSVLYDWVDKHEEFFHAKDVGSMASLYFWEKIGIQHLTYTQKGARLDAVNWIFQMRNRHKWTNKDHVEPPIVVNNYQNLSDQQLDEEIRKALKGFKHDFKVIS